jgi:hypothetical protein
MCFPGSQGLDYGPGQVDCFPSSGSFFPCTCSWSGCLCTPFEWALWLFPNEVNGPAEGQELLGCNLSKVSEFQGCRASWHMSAGQYYDLMLSADLGEQILDCERPRTSDHWESNFSS